MLPLLCAKHNITLKFVCSSHCAVHERWAVCIGGCSRCHHATRQFRLHPHAGGWPQWPLRSGRPHCQLCHLSVYCQLLWHQNEGGYERWMLLITGGSKSMQLLYPCFRLPYGHYYLSSLYSSGRKRFCYLWEHDLFWVWSGPWTSWINYERQFLWVRRLICFYVVVFGTDQWKGASISCLCLEGWSSSAGIQDQPLRLWWWRWIRFLLLPLSLSAARSEWSSGSPMDSAALKDALMVSRIQKFKFHSITNKSHVFLNVAYLVNWISFIISIKHIFCQVILKCSWSNKYKFQTT